MPVARRPPGPHLARRDAVLQEGLLRLVPRAEGKLLHAPRQVVHDLHQRRLMVPVARALSPRPGDGARATHSLQTRHLRAALVGLAGGGLQHAITQTPEAA